MLVKVLLQLIPHVQDRANISRWSTRREAMKVILEEWRENMRGL
jgi:hypothetical protein